uniref:Uncharacterized protein n=1 Tax=Kalanchoe fedtschenkoi TaxID=63787 RepID=A0A7N0UKD9_KALFE
MFVLGLTQTCHSNQLTSRKNNRYSSASPPCKLLTFLLITRYSVSPYFWQSSSTSQHSFLWTLTP